MLVVEGSARSIYQDGKFLGAGTQSANLGTLNGALSRIAGGPGGGPAASIQALAIFTPQVGQSMPELKAAVDLWIEQRKALKEYVE